MVRESSIYWMDKEYKRESSIKVKFPLIPIDLVIPLRMQFIVIRDLLEAFGQQQDFTFIIKVTYQGQTCWEFLIIQARRYRNNGVARQVCNKQLFVSKRVGTGKRCLG